MNYASLRTPKGMQLDLGKLKLGGDVYVLWSSDGNGGYIRHGFKCTSAHNPTAVLDIDARWIDNSILRVEGSITAQALFGLLMFDRSKGGASNWHETPRGRKPNPTPAAIVYGNAKIGTNQFGARLYWGEAGQPPAEFWSELLRDLERK